MIHFSKNTLKNAQVVFQVKDELKNILSDHDFDEVDLLNFAEEFTSSYREKPIKDFHRDPGFTRDYRNYDVDRAFDTHQAEVFNSEQTNLSQYYTNHIDINNLMDRIDPTWVA